MRIAIALCVLLLFATAVWAAFPTRGLYSGVSAGAATTVCMLTMSAFPCTGAL